MKNIIKNNLVNTIIIMIVFVLYETNNNFLKYINLHFLNVFFNFYFNDLLCPFGFFSTVNVLLDNISEWYVLPRFLCHGFYNLKEIFIMILIASVYWEIIYPYYHKQSVSDIVDIAMYICGAVGYWLIAKEILRKGDCK